MNLATLITYNPISCREAASLDDVRQKLSQLGVRHLPIVNDERHLVGVISKIDVLRALEARYLARTAVAVPHDVSTADAISAETETTEITASQLMTRRPLTCNTSEDVAIALARLIEYQIHSLPVLDSQRLVGMITSSDFLRELSCGGFPTSHDTCGQLLESAGDSVETDSSLEETLLAMHTSESPYVVIARGGLPVGVVSRRTLNEIHVSQQLAVAEQGDDSQYSLEDGLLDPTVTTLAQFARKSPTARPSHTQAEIARMLLDHKLEAIAVVNQAHRVLGIVTVDALLQAILVSLTRKIR